MKRRNTFAKRMLAFGLSVVMVTGLLFTSAFAYDTYGGVSNITLKNDQGRQINFIDLYGGKTTGRKDLNDEVTFYKDAITSNGFLQDWATLAYIIHEENPNSYMDNSDDGWDEAFGKGGYMDYIYDMQHASEILDWDGSNYCKRATGVSVASSLKEVQTRACEDIADLVARDMGSGSYLKRHPMDALTDMAKDVIYSTITTVDQVGTTQKFYYNSFTIAFYDFELHTLDDGKELSGEITYDEGSSEDGMIHLFTNDGTTDATANISIAQTLSETISSDISSSESYSFGQSFGQTASFSAKIPAVLDLGGELSRSLSYNQVLGTTYSDTKSITETVDKSSSVTMNVPAHTVVTGEQNISKTEKTVSYDCPVGLSYKVAIFSMCGRVYDDGAAVQDFASYEQNSFITVFGSNNGDAVEDLYQRATNHTDDTSYDETYGYTRGTSYQSGSTWCRHLNWRNIIDSGSPASKSASGLKSGTTLTYALDDTYPMSVTGASTTIKQDSVSTVVRTAEPLYPIASVYLDWQINKTFEMTAGESKAINTYRVKAADKEAIPYHGFVHSRGQWRLVDAEGKETVTDLAAMTYDSVTGEQLLTAKAPGTIYVKYFINEDTYYTYDGIESTNDTISSPAYKVIITAPQAETFNGTLELGGSADILTDGSYHVEDLINSGNITLTAYDTTGKEVEADVSWEAQELESKGISVTEDGVITATKAGTFHIRAYCDDIYSDWVELRATEPVSLIISTQDHTFTDVSTDAWYDDAVGYVLQNDIMYGVGNKQFAPNQPVTRAMMIQVLYNMAGRPGAETWASFSDVEKEAWFAKAIAWAQEKGLAEGYDADRFAPNDPVTREQMVTFICRYLNWKYEKEFEGVVDLSIFRDESQISDWAKDFVVQAVLLGIIQGKGEGCLDPQGTATRAELAQVLYNMKDLIL